MSSRSKSSGKTRAAPLWQLLYCILTALVTLHQVFRQLNLKGQATNGLSGLTFCQGQGPHNFSCCLKK